MRVLTTLLLSLMVAGTAHAQQWTEGTHYQRLPDAPQRAPDAPLEVVEVFWYGCGACFQFEPLMSEWERSRPADVTFERVGVTFSGVAQIHARAFYTARALGVAECVHRPIFNAIHTARRPLADIDSLAAFFQDTANVPPVEFRRAWDGFGVDRDLRAGDQLIRQFRVGSTPTLIVNRTFTMSPSSAGGYLQAIQLLNYLLEMERGAPNEFSPERTPEPCPAAGAVTAAGDTADTGSAMAMDPPANRSLMFWLPIAGGVFLVLIGIRLWSARRKS